MSIPYIEKSKNLDVVAKAAEYSSIDRDIRDWCLFHCEFLKYLKEKISSLKCLLNKYCTYCTYSLPNGVIYHPSITLSRIRKEGIEFYVELVYNSEAEDDIRVSETVYVDFATLTSKDHKIWGAWLKSHNNRIHSKLRETQASISKLLKIK